jgi:glycine oxidase
VHTILLGNGIIALTTAFRLAKRAGPQDKVTIVGRAVRPGSATLAAAAMLNSFAEIEVGSLETELDLYRFEISHLAGRMWPKFERELIDAAGDALPSPCRKCEGFPGGGCAHSGTFVVNNTAADDLDDENFDAILKALADFDEPHSLVSPKEIPNYKPAQRERATRALYIPGEGWFNPRIMMEKLDAIVRRFPQVECIDADVAKLEASAGRIDAAVLSDGRRLQGDKYILATGATATDLLAASGIDLPIQRVFYGVGVSVEIRSPDAPHTKCIRTPNRGLACGIYSVPYFIDPDLPNDHILVGASNFISPVPYPYGRLTSVSSLMEAAMAQINSDFYRADLVRVNVGWRPTSQDTYPLVGPTSIPNLIVATGTKRDGIHLSPLLSQYLVAMVHDEPVDERFAVFAPERAPLRPLGRAEAVAKAARHLMSASYQHGFSPAQNRMPQQVLKMYTDDLERLHDQVGAHDWGIPPEMLDMYRYGHARA